MTKAILLACGPLSAFVYLTFDLAARAYPGYSYSAQTISEISAIGAASRPLAVQIGFAYDILLIAFAAGLWLVARGPALRIAALALAAIGALGFAWPPMHMRGVAFGPQDSMHIIFAGITSLLILIAIISGAAAFGNAFRRYSFATVIVMSIAGAATGSQASKIAANLPPPWAGITERIDVGTYLLWVTVLGLMLLRTLRSPNAEGARLASQ